MDQPHSWEFYTFSDTAWEGMLDSCRQARRTIDLEQFAFGEKGTVERAFADLFIQKAKEGVRIRLLFDTVGSFRFYRSALHKELKSAGVQVFFHHAILPATVKRLIPMVLRDHRKLLVIDGQEAHIGGVIIEERARLWRDTAVSIRGRIGRASEHLRSGATAGANNETGGGRAFERRTTGILLSRRLCRAALLQETLAARHSAVLVHVPHSACQSHRGR